MIADYFQIRVSGRFDSEHYLAQIKRRRLKHYWPLLHYIVSGERKGLEPAANFAPLLYLGRNEHLIDLHANLFAHFLKTPRRAEALKGDTGTAEIESARGLLAQFTPKHDVAIACHMFYFHLIDEITDVLSQLDFGYDLVCTITRKNGMEEAIARIIAQCPTAVVLPFPNVGRDVFPFLWLAGTGAFAKHSAVCQDSFEKKPAARRRRSLAARAYRRHPGELVARAAHD